MVTDEEWAGWLKEPWAVIPALPVVPESDDDPPLGWLIVMKKDVRSHTADELGPLYKDEEPARHIVRCHNQWLARVKPRKERNANPNPAPSQGRAPES